MIQVFKNNVLGTAILTKYSKKFRVESFTLISTDKAVNPTNVMGASKRLAELLCLTSGDDETQRCLMLSGLETYWVHQDQQFRSLLNR